MKLTLKLCAMAAFALSTFQYSDAAVSFIVDLDADTDGVQSERSIVVGQTVVASVIFTTDGVNAITGDSEAVAGYNFDVNFDPTVVLPGPTSGEEALSGFTRDRLDNPVPVNVVDRDGVTRQTLPNTPDLLMATNRSQNAANNVAPFFTGLDGNNVPQFARDNDGELIFGRTDLLPQLTPDDPSLLGIPGSFTTISAGLTSGGFSGEYNASVFTFTLTGLAPSLVAGDNVTIGGEGVLFTGDDDPVNATDARVTFNGARLSVSAVPEPSSLLAFVSVAGFAGLRRRRRK